jgi:uncharacterized protein DUF5946
MYSCPECNAEYVDVGDSCTTRFEQLLALDHSRAEPWGSRHAQAFAAFALQHPTRHTASLDVAWEILYRIYCGKEAPSHVVASVRNGARKLSEDMRTPPRAPHPLGFPTITIADLGDFSAATYPGQLDDWCRAALKSWGGELTCEQTEKTSS